MPETEWSVADAKSKLSEVLNRADKEPQVITRRDRRYVVVEGERYQRLTGAKPDLRALILQGPSLEGIDLSRDRSLGRELEL